MNACCASLRPSAAWVDPASAAEVDTPVPPHAGRGTLGVHENVSTGSCSRATPRSRQPGAAPCVPVYTA